VNTPSVVAFVLGVMFGTAVLLIVLGSLGQL